MVSNLIRFTVKQEIVGMRSLPAGTESRDRVQQDREWGRKVRSAGWVFCVSLLWQNLCMSLIPSVASDPSRCTAMVSACTQTASNWKKSCTISKPLLATPAHVMCARWIRFLRGLEAYMLVLCVRECVRVCAHVFQCTWVSVTVKRERWSRLWLDGARKKEGIKHLYGVLIT